MRKLIAAVLVVALAGVLAATALAAGRTVKVGDDYFVKNNGNRHTLRISKGTKVTFRWVGTNPHNVHATKGPQKFSSRVQTSGRYKHRFTKRGTYRLVCDVHRSQMKLTVKVK